MKIALIGTAPGSIRKGPYADPSWKIWACSPGAYAVVPRSDAWFELHRWEPPVIGKPDQQVPWFSPEYCMFLRNHPLVFIQSPTPDLPKAVVLPWQDLVQKYGHYFFTSSIAWMYAVAIEEILRDRELRGTKEEDAIGLWGIDMSATEEYGYQRAGCQFFAQMAASVGIKLVVPPESDIMMPPPLYGISEGSPMAIKLLTRRREIEGRLAQAEQRKAQAESETYFLKGALDDIIYTQGTWIHQGDALGIDVRALIDRTRPEQPKVDGDNA
jgi:hypothetical protein